MNFNEPYALVVHRTATVLLQTIPHYTERLDRVANTPTSHSGGPGFKSRPGDRLS
jgi:hypothetical protein